MIRPRACIVSVVRPARDVRTFHKEARSLAAAGWDVTVIGRDDGPPAIVDGVRIVPLRVARGAGRLAAQGHALRRALAIRPDVIQIADLELLPAALLLRRRGRAVVYDCIEDYPAYMAIKSWLHPRLRGIAAQIVERLERVVTPRLDAVFTADMGTAERLARYGAEVVVLHNFPRRDDFRPAPPAAPRMHDVVYHGSLPPYHLDALGEIATTLAQRRPGTRWTIVGRPDAATARARFLARVRDAGVALLPRVDFGAVPGLLRAARTAVVPLPDVPKFRTNVPMKVFEYMAAGVPVVTSDLPPIRRLLAGTDTAVLVRPGDHAAAAAALGSLLDDPTQAAVYARCARTLIDDRLNWEREEQRLVARYAALVPAPGPAPIRGEAHA